MTINLKKRVLPIKIISVVSGDIVTLHSNPLFPSFLIDLWMNMNWWTNNTSIFCSNEQLFTNLFTNTQASQYL